jgi:predicted PurR-regulated permease PerM
MNITRKKIFHGVLAVLGLILLYYSGVVLIYLIMALVLSLMLSPVNQLLRKVRFHGYGITNTVASIITMAFLIGFFTVIIQIFVPIISKEVTLLSNLKMDDFYELVEPEVKSLSSVLRTVEFDAEQSETSEREAIKRLFLGKKNVDRVPQFFSGIATGIGGSLVTLFSVFFITFFLLKDDNLFNDFVYSLSSGNHIEKVKTVLKKVKKTLSRYFIGIAIQVSIITTIVSIGLSVFGVRNAVVIGLFAGIMNVIPYIGPVFGLGFGLLIGISTNVEMAAEIGMYSLIGRILLVFGITQLVDNFFTQPVVFSKSINAHPLEVFLVILIAGNISGIPGMIIAVPFYSVIRIIAKEYYSESKFIQFMTSEMK